MARLTVVSKDTTPTPPHRTDNLELIATFRGYCKGMTTNHRSGEAIFTLAVPIEDRDIAEILDKSPGIMLTIKAYRPMRVPRGKGNGDWREPPTV